MANEVVIKSNRYGLNLILDEGTPFPELLRIIGNKFQETGSFFKDAKMAISFEGRRLSAGEQKRIADVIMENSSIQIVCIMEQNTALEAEMKARTEGAPGRSAGRQSGREAPAASGRGAAASGREIPAGDGNADFYKGNLGSGQILESGSHLTLIGGVHPGANIVSGGSLVILGSLKGNARAGAAGDGSCFIFALDMKPIQLQIGDFIAKSPDRDRGPKRLRRKDREGDALPRVAVVRDGNICIEPMTKGFLDRL